MSTISRVHSNEKATNRLTKKQKTIVSLPTPPTSSAGLEPLQRVRLCVLKKNNVNAKRNRTITHTHTHTPIHRHRQKKIVTDADVATPCRFPTRRSAASAGTRATATGSVWTSRATKTTPASSWGPSTRPPVPVNGWARPLLAQLGRFRCFFFFSFWWNPWGNWKLRFELVCPSFCFQISLVQHLQLRTIAFKLLSSPSSK